MAECAQDCGQFVKLVESGFYGGLAFPPGDPGKNPGGFFFFPCRVGLPNTRAGGGRGRPRNPVAPGYKN